MKLNSIFIDLANKEQVNWWNKWGNKLVKTVRYDTIVETATNKPVGVIFMIEGLFRKYVIMKNNQFIKNAVTSCITIKD